MIRDRQTDRQTDRSPGENNMSPNPSGGDIIVQLESGSSAEGCLVVKNVYWPFGMFVNTSPSNLE